MNKVYVNDVGTVILLDTGVDLSGGTLSIKYRKPDGATGSWSGTIANTSSGAGKGISYTTVAGDLSVSGAWKLQAHAVLPNGTWSGETVTLFVHSPFE